MSYELANHKDLQFQIVNEVNSKQFKIYQDGYKLAQILLNLLENSIQNTQSGKIQLKVQNHGGLESDMFKITISDTGKGFKNEEEMENHLEIMSSNYREKNFYKSHTLGMKISHKLTGLIGPQCGLVYQRSLSKGTQVSFLIYQKCKQFGGQSQQIISLENKDNLHNNENGQSHNLSNNAGMNGGIGGSMSKINFKQSSHNYISQQDILPKIPLVNSHGNNMGTLNNQLPNNNNNSNSQQVQNNNQNYNPQTFQQIEQQEDKFQQQYYMEVQQINNSNYVKNDIASNVLLGNQNYNNTPEQQQQQYNPIHSNQNQINPFKNHNSSPINQSQRQKNLSKASKQSRSKQLSQISQLSQNSFQQQQQQMYSQWQEGIQLINQQQQLKNSQILQNQHNKDVQNGNILLRVQKVREPPHQYYNKQSEIEEETQNINNSNNMSVNSHNNSMINGSNVSLQQQQQYSGMAFLLQQQQSHTNLRQNNGAYQDQMNIQKDVLEQQNSQQKLFNN